MEQVDLPRSCHVCRCDMWQHIAAGTAGCSAGGAESRLCALCRMVAAYGLLRWRGPMLEYIVLAYEIGSGIYITSDIDVRCTYCRHSKFFKGLFAWELHLHAYSSLWPGRHMAKLTYDSSAQ